MRKKKTPWEKEWIILQKDEAKYTAKRVDGPTSVLVTKLESVVPQKLREKINFAFQKGFTIIFEKGTKIIERTYNKKKKENDFKVNAFSNELRRSSHSAHKFMKSAKSTQFLNLLISLVEGIGLGLLGISIVGMPIFLGMILKSVYEVCLSFGYDYHDEGEKILIMKIIEVSMLDSENFERGNAEVNEAIDSIVLHGDVIEGWNVSKEEQIKLASDSIAKETTCMKFIESIAIVGVVGGLFDPVYINRITEYAVLKYGRRFLKKQLLEEEYNAQYE